MICLFLSGLANDGSCPANITPEGTIRVTLEGSTNVFNLLQDFQGERRRFILAGHNAPQDFKFDYWPDVIFNEISDPDSHENALHRCISFIDTQKKPVINHPKAILLTRRDQIYDRLHDIDGLNVPKTIRLFPQSPQEVINAIDSADFHYPVIFRQAGDHGGISTTLLKKESDISRAMYQYALDGRAYYITQFTDYKSADGLYRKYRIAVINGVPFLRHMVATDNWLIHISSRKYMLDKPLLQQEEEKLLQEFSDLLAPKLLAVIQSITQTLQLDYYGIDCNISSNNDILAFEINANMNILINTEKSPNVWDLPIINMKKQVCKLIAQKAQS